MNDHDDNVTHLADRIPDARSQDEQQAAAEREESRLMGIGICAVICVLAISIVLASWIWQAGVIFIGLAAACVIAELTND